jgi:hypothetical protein
MDNFQSFSVLSVFSCSKHFVPRATCRGLAWRAARKALAEGGYARRVAEVAEKEYLAGLLE